MIVSWIYFTFISTKIYKYITANIQTILRQQKTFLPWLKKNLNLFLDTFWVDEIPGLYWALVDGYQKLENDQKGILTSINSSQINFVARKHLQNAIHFHYFHNLIRFVLVNIYRGLYMLKNCLKRHLFCVDCWVEWKESSCTCSEAWNQQRNFQKLFFMWQRLIT